MKTTRVGDEFFSEMAPHLPGDLSLIVDHRSIVIDPERYPRFRWLWGQVLDSVNYPSSNTPRNEDDIKITFAGVDTWYHRDDVLRLVIRTLFITGPGGKSPRFYSYEKADVPPCFARAVCCLSRGHVQQQLSIAGRDPNVYPAIEYAIRSDFAIESPGSITATDADALSTCDGLDLTLFAYLYFRVRCNDSHLYGLIKLRELYCYWKLFFASVTGQKLFLPQNEPLQATMSEAYNRSKSTLLSFFDMGSEFRSIIRGERPLATKVSAFEVPISEILRTALASSDKASTAIARAIPSTELHAVTWIEHDPVSFAIRCAGRIIPADSLYQLIHANHEYPACLRTREFPKVEASSFKCIPRALLSHIALVQTYSGDGLDARVVTYATATTEIWTGFAICNYIEAAKQGKLSMLCPLALCCFTMTHRVKVDDVWLQMIFPGERIRENAMQRLIGWFGSIQRFRLGLHELISLGFSLLSLLCGARVRMSFQGQSFLFGSAAREDESLTEEQKQLILAVLLSPTTPHNAFNFFLMHLFPMPNASVKLKLDDIPDLRFVSLQPPVSTTAAAVDAAPRHAVVLLGIEIYARTGQPPPAGFEHKCGVHIAPRKLPIARSLDWKWLYLDSNLAFLPRTPRAGDDGITGDMKRVIVDDPLLSRHSILSSQEVFAEDHFVDPPAQAEPPTMAFE